MDPLSNDITTATLLREAAHYGITLLGAVVILVVGWLGAGWAGRSLRATLAKYAWLDATLAPLVASIVHYTILIAVLLVVLGQFGVQLTSIVAVLGAAGLAIALALQGTLANVASGVMLVFLRPFHVGDSIEAASFSGEVVEVGLFTTTLRSAENRFIYIPNKMLFDGAIINDSRLPLRKTQHIPVELRYGSDIERALDILRRVLQAEKRLLADPPPRAGVSEWGDGAVKLALSFSTENATAEQVRLDLNFAIKRELAAAGLRLAQEPATDES